jgi:hypothetical protein
MKPSIRLPLAVSYDVIDAQRIVSVHVGADSVARTCMCLQVLLYNLAEEYVISHQAGKCVMRVAHNNAIALDSSSTNIVTMEFTRDSCHLLIAFFLRYFRDGYSAVNHVDIETTDGSYITVYLDVPIVEVSADELRRRLGG